MKNGLLRQGDILLVPVDTIPQGLKEIPRKNSLIILAEGEATGHLHVIDSTDVTFLATDETDIENRFLEVEAEVKLTHPEHDTVTINPGKYEVRRQREFTEAGGIRIVAD